MERNPVLGCCVQLWWPVCLLMCGLLLFYGSECSISIFCLFAFLVHREKGLDCFWCFVGEVVVARGGVSGVDLPGLDSTRDDLFISVVRSRLLVPSFFSSSFLPPSLFPLFFSLHSLPFTPFICIPPYHTHTPSHRPLLSLSSFSSYQAAR